MALTSLQDKERKRVRRQVERPHRKLSALDAEVLRLTFARYTAEEIAAALGISEGAAYKAFERVADFLAPLPPSKVSIDPADCLPFVDETFA